jgi:hypothetical protein
LATALGLFEPDDVIAGDVVVAAELVADEKLDPAAAVGAGVAAEVFLDDEELEEKNEPPDLDDEDELELEIERDDELEDLNEDELPRAQRSELTSNILQHKKTSNFFMHILLCYLDLISNFSHFLMISLRIELGTFTKKASFFCGSSLNRHSLDTTPCWPFLPTRSWK